MRFMCDTSRAGFVPTCDQKKRYGLDYVPYPTPYPTMAPMPTAMPTSSPTPAPSICKFFFLFFDVLDLLLIFCTLFSSYLFLCLVTFVFLLVYLFLFCSFSLFLFLPLFPSFNLVVICLCLSFVLSFLFLVRSVFLSISLPVPSLFFFFFVSWAGQNFALTAIGNKAYEVSNANLKLSFANAASLCQTCFGTALGDITNAGAISGSPSHASVSDLKLLCLASHWVR